MSCILYVTERSQDMMVGLRPCAQWRRSCGGPPGILTPSLSGRGVQMFTDLQFLPPWWYTWPVVIHSRLSVLLTVAELCIHADFCTWPECGFYKAVWLYKLYQNVWQRVSWLCPDPIDRESTRGRGRQEDRRGREVAWTPWQIVATDGACRLRCLDVSHTVTVELATDGLMTGWKVERWQPPLMSLFSASFVINYSLIRLCNYTLE